MVTGSKQVKRLIGNLPNGLCKASMLIFDDEGFDQNARPCCRDSVRLRKYRTKFYSKRNGKDGLDFHWCLLAEGKERR